MIVLIYFVMAALERNFFLNRYVIILETNIYFKWVMHLNLVYEKHLYCCDKDWEMFNFLL